MLDTSPTAEPHNRRGIAGPEDEVGAKSRRERAVRRRKRRERVGASSTPSVGPSRLRRRLGRWVVPGGVGIVVVLIIAAIVWPAIRNSTQPRLGEEVTEEVLGQALHDPAGIPIRDGDPLPGGRHNTLPQSPDFYEEQIQDGAAIHALEHGLIWIAYQPDLVTPEDVEVLRGVQDRFSRDVIVSPRPQNETPITALSWGRILRMDTADDDLLRDFVRRNRDRSPEPGIR